MRRVVLLLNTQNKTSVVDVMGGQQVKVRSHTHVHHIQTHTYTHTHIHTCTHNHKRAALSSVDFQHGFRTQSYSQINLTAGTDGRFDVTLDGFAVALLVLEPGV